MSDQTIKLVAAGVLLLHGLGHGGALGALAWIRFNPGSNTGAWLAARSWLAPSLSGDTATTLASALWIVSLVGFVITAMSFWGVLVPGSVWRPLAVNVAVLAAVLWLRWPSEAMLGS